MKCGGGFFTERILVNGQIIMYNDPIEIFSGRYCSVEEHSLPNEPVAEETPEVKKRGRYKPWIRLVALLLVIAILMSITRVDFSLMQYQGTDQMVAAQYLMDSTSYLGESRIQRLKSLLTGVDPFSINLQAAEIAIAKTDYGRAAEFLCKCIPESPDNLQKAELYNRLGCVYMLNNDPVQAVQAFESSIELDSQEPSPYLLRAQLRYQGGEIAGAVEDACTYLDLGGNDVDMLSTVSSICELGGDMESAVDAMTLMIQMASDDTVKARAHAERGRLLYLQGLENEAAADIVSARKLNSGVLTGVHYAIIGLHEYSTGDYAAGKDDFLQAARLSEDGNAEYYEQSILCGYLSEDYAFIQQTITEAKGRNMMTASSWLIDGILQFSQEKYEDADTSLTASIDTGKIVPGAYYYRGLTRMASGNYEDAVGDFTESLNWEENKIGCIFNRGVCYFAMEEDELAKADLTHVIDDNTDAALVTSAQELLNTMEALEEEMPSEPDGEA